MFFNCQIVEFINAFYQVLYFIIVKHYVLHSIRTSGKCNTRICQVNSESSFSISLKLTSLTHSRYLRVEGTLERNFMKTSLSGFSRDGCAQDRNFCPWRPNIQKTMSFSFTWPRVERDVSFC